MTQPTSVVHQQVPDDRSAPSRNWVAKAIWIWRRAVVGVSLTAMRALVRVAPIWLRATGRVVDVAGIHRQALAQAYLAWWEIYEKHWIQALISCELATVLYPEHPDGWIMLERLWRRAGFSKRAKQVHAHAASLAIPLIECGHFDCYVRRQLEHYKQLEVFERSLVDNQDGLSTSGALTAIVAEGRRLVRARLQFLANVRPCRIQANLDTRRPIVGARAPLQQPCSSG